VEQLYIYITYLNNSLFYLLTTTPVHKYLKINFAEIDYYFISIN